MRRDEHPLAARWIHAGPSAALDHFESAEITNSYRPAIDQRGLDRGKDRFNDLSGLTFGQGAVTLINRVDKIGLGSPLAVEQFPTHPGSEEKGSPPGKIPPSGQFLILRFLQRSLKV